MSEVIGSLARWQPGLSKSELNAVYSAVIEHKAANRRLRLKTQRKDQKPLIDDVQIIIIFPRSLAGASLTIKADSETIQ